MQKRYGLFTAISMVVGIVIGSGIFFKATKVLANNNGDMGRSLLTVGIVGAIMLICSFVFANLASRYEKVNGVVDYAEAALGRGYAYYVAWFMTLIYYPTITSTLGWVTSQYAAILFGFPVAGMTHYWVGFGILLADGLINAYAPRLAGKLQVSATVIKLIPLILMAVAGTITGLSNGLTVEAFTAASAQIASQGSGLMGAIVAFAFAYEGWIIATSINSELHNAKKNLRGPYRQHEYRRDDGSRGYAPGKGLRQSVWPGRRYHCICIYCYQLPGYYQWPDDGLRPRGLLAGRPRGGHRAAVLCPCG